MQKSILLYLSKLEGFKTAIKNCHWAAKSMNAHKFMDSLEDMVSDHQDLVAEIVQGAYNTKIKVNDFKPRLYRISTFTKLVSDIYNAADKFYATIQGNKRFIGLRSVMEDFMGKMQQQMYLNAMCTESIKEVKNLIKENMEKNVIRLTENQLHDVIAESVYRVLKENGSLNDKSHINPEEYSNIGMTVTSGHDPLEEINEKFFGGQLTQLRRFFKTPLEQFRTVRGYLDYESRRGERPSIDGLLNFIGYSRKDLKNPYSGFDRSY